MTLPYFGRYTSEANQAIRFDQACRIKNVRVVTALDCKPRRSRWGADMRSEVRARCDELREISALSGTASAQQGEKCRLCATSFSPCARQWDDSSRKFISPHEDSPLRPGPGRASHKKRNWDQTRVPEILASGETSGADSNFGNVNRSGRIVVVYFCGMHDNAVVSFVLLCPSHPEFRIHA
jgi:hypothetical protein